MALPVTRQEIEAVVFKMQVLFQSVFAFGS